MATRRSQSQEDIHFWVMRHLQDNPHISQRELAKELGISLGSINYCLQALIDKGWLKIQNFKKSQNKLGYIYLLTPKGVAQKSVITARFLGRKLDEYDMLREEIERLREEIKQQDSNIEP